MNKHTVLGLLVLGIAIVTVMTIMFCALYNMSKTVTIINAFDPSTNEQIEVIIRE